MPFMHSLAPNFKWAQRKNKVWIKIELPNVHDEEIHLDPNGALHFYGKSELKGSHCYKLHLDLFSTINDVVSRYFLNFRERIWHAIILEKHLEKERMECAIYYS